MKSIKILLVLSGIALMLSTLCFLDDTEDTSKLRQEISSSERSIITLVDVNNALLNAGVTDNFSETLDVVDRMSVVLAHNKSKLEKSRQLRETGVLFCLIGGAMIAGGGILSLLIRK